MNCDGLRCDVYRDLNDGCLSVRSRETGSDTYGTVVEHVDSIIINDADFIIQSAGQQKVRDDGVKNVHTMVRGVCVATDDAADPLRDELALSGREVRYNPFETDTFEYTSTGDPVYHKPAAYIATNGMEVFETNV